MALTKTELSRNYRNTPYGRALVLLNNYRRHDRYNGRGEGDLTAKWIVDNILSKPCAHCGVTGWDIIGCNRLDNSKPHTMDNVEPCCLPCNCNLNDNSDKKRKVYQYSLDGELVGVYESTTEAARKNGYSQGNIWCVLAHKTDKAYGYKWSYEPL